MIAHAALGCAVGAVKLSARLLKKALKNGKLTARDIKEAGLDELVAFADDLATLANPDSTLVDRALAVLSLTVGLGKDEIDAISGGIKHIAGKGKKHRPDGGLETPDIPSSQIARNKAAGDAAADRIAANYPGSRREVTRNTSDGPRRIDVLTPDGGAIESKVGRTHAGSETLRQVNKDRELLENGTVNSVTWEFRRSAQTGRVGPTPRLQAELEAAGIGVRIVD